MKAVKTVISIVFIVGTGAIIFFDRKSKARKKAESSTSVKIDSVSHHKK